VSALDTRAASLHGMSDDKSSDRIGIVDIIFAFAIVGAFCGGCLGADIGLHTSQSLRIALIGAIVGAFFWGIVGAFFSGYGGAFGVGVGVIRRWIRAADIGGYGGAIVGAIIGGCVGALGYSIMFHFGDGDPEVFQRYTGGIRRCAIGCAFGGAIIGGFGGAAAIVGAIFGAIMIAIFGALIGAILGESASKIVTYAGNLSIFAAMAFAFIGASWYAGKDK
jgi:hypothetical protein